MNVEVFTGIGPDFRPLTTVEFHCPSCGRRMRMPTELLLESIPRRIEEYYRERSDYLVAENKKLREIIEYGNQVALIKRMAEKL